MNSTAWTSGPPGVNMSTLPYLQGKLSLYRPELELLWVLLTYAPFLQETMRYTSGKFSRARKFPYITLLTHIVTAPMLVLRYHARFAALRIWPRPELTDLALFAVFNLTSFMLEAHRSSQHYSTPTRRTGFQAVILIQASVFAASWFRERDAALFRASIKLLNWFASYRIFSRLAGHIEPSLQKDFALKSSTTVIVSGAFAMWEAGVPGGLPVFFGLAAMFMVAERAIAESIYV